MSPIDNTAESNLIIVGLDWSPDKNINVIPNVEVVVYSEPDEGEKPDTTVIPRITLFYRF